MSRPTPHAPEYLLQDLPPGASDHAQLMAELASLRTQVLTTWSGPLQEHPWRLFASADLANEDHELLLRALRFAAIQLSKFWIEVQSFPLFLNLFNTTSFAEVEAILQWLHTGRAWSISGTQARLIPLFLQVANRQTLLSFVRNVRSVRALQKTLSERRVPAAAFQPLSLPLLQEAIELVRAHQFENHSPQDLVRTLERRKDRLDQIRLIQSFFHTLSERAQFPPVLDFGRARATFSAVETFKRTSEDLYDWRHLRVLGVGQRVRIKAWKDRAKPLLEMRRRIEDHFERSPERAVSPEILRDLATALTTGGLWRRFKAPFREAKEAYRDLLRGTKGKLPVGTQETSLQMAERLQEWATYIEQCRIFEENAEARAIFGRHFQGIDTDFLRAEEANAWAAQVRADLGHDEFGELLITYLFRSQPTQLKAFIAHFEQAELASGVQARVHELERDEKVLFETIARREQSTLADLERLREITAALGLKSQFLYRNLGELSSLADEVHFLEQQLEQSFEVKNWLKADFKGVETQLAVIEQPLQFLHYIESALIPDYVKTLFIHLHGPQRYAESQLLASATLPALSAVRDHLHRLEAFPHPRETQLTDAPIPLLLEEMQRAYRQPHLLHSWVEYQKREKALREPVAAS